MFLQAGHCTPEALTTRPMRDNRALLGEQQVGLESGAERVVYARAMRFAVQHETLFRYSVPVVLAPHVLRLTPRSTDQVRTRSLVVWPEPVGVRQENDAYGNRIVRVQFSEQATQDLRIESRFELETSPLPPAFEPSERLPLR